MTSRVSNLVDATSQSRFVAGITGGSDKAGIAQRLPANGTPGAAAPASPAAIVEKRLIGRNRLIGRLISL
jgi:hypothetical protein